MEPLMKEQGLTEEEAMKKLAEKEEAAKGSIVAKERVAEKEEKDELRMSRINLAKSLQNAGYSNEGIAKYMGIAESSVRELLK